MHLNLLNKCGILYMYVIITSWPNIFLCLNKCFQLNVTALGFFWARSLWFLSWSGFCCLRKHTTDMDRRSQTLLKCAQAFRKKGHLKYTFKAHLRQSSTITEAGKNQDFTIKWNIFNSMLLKSPWKGCFIEPCSLTSLTSSQAFPNRENKALALDVQLQPDNQT